MNCTKHDLGHHIIPVAAYIVNAVPRNSITQTSLVDFTQSENQYFTKKKKNTQINDGVRQPNLLKLPQKKKKKKKKEDVKPAISNQNLNTST